MTRRARLALFWSAVAAALFVWGWWVMPWLLGAGG